MKFIFLVFTFALTFLITDPIGNLQAGGPTDKATGYTYGHIAERAWWHLLEVSAQPLDDPPYPYAGKGFIRHLRQDDLSLPPGREEVCDVVYTYIDGNEAWFAGPIVYDSMIEYPSRWMVFYVMDGGQPGAVWDDLRWQRVDDGDTAEKWLDKGRTRLNTAKHALPNGYKDYVITDGNVKVR